MGCGAESGNACQVQHRYTALLRHGSTRSCRGSRGWQRAASGRSGGHATPRHVQMRSCCWPCRITFPAGGAPRVIRVCRRKAGVGPLMKDKESLSAGVRRTLFEYAAVIESALATTKELARIYTSLERLRRLSMSNAWYQLHSFVWSIVSRRHDCCGLYLHACILLTRFQSTILR